MGWDVWLAVSFQQKEDPVQRFVRVAARFAASERHHEVLRLLVRNSVYSKDILENLYIGSNRETPITAEQIQQLPQRYQGEALAVEGWWRVSPRYLIDDKTDAPLSGDYRVIVTTVGSSFPWPGLSKQSERVDLVYEPGDFKHFLPSLGGEAARLNIEALIQEVPLLIALGAQTIRGLDAERSRDPRDHYLCYHRNPDNYRLDLQTISNNGLNLRALGTEDILNAALICSDVSFRETDGGLIIYHKEFVDGNLKNFYQELLKLCSGD